MDEDLELTRVPRDDFDFGPREPGQRPFRSPISARDPDAAYRSAFGREHVLD